MPQPKSISSIREIQDKALSGHGIEPWEALRLASYFKAIVEELREELGPTKAELIFRRAEKPHVENYLKRRESDVSKGRKGGQETGKQRAEQAKRWQAALRKLATQEWSERPSASASHIANIARQRGILSEWAITSSTARKYIGTLR